MKRLCFYRPFDTQTGRAHTEAVVSTVYMISVRQIDLTLKALLCCAKDLAADASILLTSRVRDISYDSTILRIKIRDYRKSRRCRLVKMR